MDSILEEDEMIEVSVSYEPYDAQSSLSYFFHDWEETNAFIRLSISHGFVVQVSIFKKKS